MKMIFQEFSIKRKCIFQETWSVGPNVVLSDFNLEVTSGGSPELIVGSGLVGCVREGPGVRFTRNDTSLVNSQHVRWGLGDNCLLPNTCSGKTKLSKVYSLELFSFVSNDSIQATLTFFGSV